MVSRFEAGALPPRLQHMFFAVPGCGIAAAGAWLAISASHAIGSAFVSPALLALGAGVLMASLLRNSGAMLSPGLAFSQRTLLRLAVVLLGSRLFFPDVLSLHPLEIAASIGVIIVVCLTGALALRVMSTVNNVPALLMVGTAVCGASAIAAASLVLRTRESETSQSIVLVTLFGCVFMTAVHPLALWLGLDMRQTATWAGASLHEVAHVVGAAASWPDGAIVHATVIKLIRVACLAPVLVFLTWLTSSKNGAHKPPLLPAFLLGFTAVSVLTSLHILPEVLIQTARATSGFLLVMALFAIGAATRWSQLVRTGWRTIAIATAFALVAFAFPPLMLLFFS